jgi:hypothetical protein
MPDPLPENQRKPTELPTDIILSQNLSVYTDRFSDGVVTSADFTDGMTEGFKLRYLYNDVALSPMESLTEVIHR